MEAVARAPAQFGTQIPTGQAQRAPFRQLPAATGSANTQVAAQKMKDTAAKQPTSRDDGLYIYGTNKEGQKIKMKVTPAQYAQFAAAMRKQGAS